MTGEMMELPDGRVVDSWSAEYRDWCEAWWYLDTLPKNPLWAAEKFLKAVEKARGAKGKADLLKRVGYVAHYYFQWKDAA